MFKTGNKVVIANEVKQSPEIATPFGLAIRLCHKSEKCENKNFFSHFALYFVGYLGFGCYFRTIFLVFFPLLKFAEGYDTA